MFPVIELCGAAFERGRVHGEAAHARIHRSVATYAKLFAFCGIGWDEAQALGAGYRDVIGALDAELLEEMEGIAAGSGRSPNEILALNARTEILPSRYPDEPHPERARVARVNAQAGVPDWGECTAIAVKPAGSRDGETLLGQNWDWLGAQRGALLLLRVREPDGRSCLTLTEAGMLAKIGLNDRGLGICLNILRSVTDGSRPGVPVHVLLRALLRRTSVADAIRFASGLAYGASSNVLCADTSGDAASLEVSPRGLELVRGQGVVLCHTNHFLSPEAARAGAPLPASFSSVPRLERARALMDSIARVGVADLERTLRDESEGTLSICRRPDPALPAEARIETVASVVMQLGAGIMHVAADVPSLVSYEPVPLAAEPALLS